MLLLAFGVLAALAAVTAIALGLRRQRIERKRLARERAAREQVARKAAASAPTQPAQAIDLSQSAVISIQGEIDRCISQGRWDEGAKWAAHAIQTQPDQPDFRLKLAEIHCRAGHRREFLAVFEDLRRRLPVHDERRQRLLALAREILPEPPR
jgi:hypothetical protein